MRNEDTRFRDLLFRLLTDKDHCGVCAVMIAPGDTQSVLIMTETYPEPRDYETAVYMHLECAMSEAIH